MQLNPAQAKCLERFGVFIAQLDRADIPLDHPVTAELGGEAEPKECVVVAEQDQQSGERLYVIALRSQCQEVDGPRSS